MFLQIPIEEAASLIKNGTGKCISLNVVIGQHLQEHSTCRSDIKSRR